MLSELVPATFVDLLDWQGDSAIAFILLHTGQISQCRASHGCCFLSLLLPLALLSPFSHNLATLPTEDGHVALRVSDGRDRFQLLCEDRAPVEKRRPKIVDQQMNSSCLLILWHKVTIKVSSLCHTRCEHAIRFPVVDVLAFRIP